MSDPAVLAVDGGNSKTDVALVGRDGDLLAFARGVGSSHQNIGIASTIEVLGDLIGKVRAAADLPPGRPVAQRGEFYLAGADLPEEVELLSQAIRSMGWTNELVVDNDTFALLRAGSESPDRIAVVCGAGINCVGVSGDGGVVRFPALGRISGDWGGGGELGAEALWHAARAEDGRGEPTALAQAVAQHFGCARPKDVASAIHFGTISPLRIHELSRVLLRVASEGDPVACRVVERQAEEVVLLVMSTLRRLDLLDAATDVVLGGGVLAARHPLLLSTIKRSLDEQAPHAVLRVVDDPPVVGAALLGLDHEGASAHVEQRLRTALLAASRSVGGDH